MTESRVKAAGLEKDRNGAELPENWVHLLVDVGIKRHNQAKDWEEKGFLITSSK